MQLFGSQWIVLLFGAVLVVSIEQSSFGRVFEYVRNISSDGLDLNKRGFHSQVTMLHDDIGEYAKREFIGARL